MSKQAVAILTLTIKATEDISAHRFVTLNGGYLASPAAGAPRVKYGVSLTEAKTGELFSVVVLGTAVVQAKLDFDVNTQNVQSDADGTAVAGTDQQAAFALQTQASTPQSRLVEVLLA